MRLRTTKMNKEIDVTALGEVLIDFTFSGVNSEGKKIYEENPGGAPGNCVCAVAKLGGKSAFIGMTGQDSFGEDICQALKACGVNVSGIKKTSEQHTTLAFVSLDEKGERSFSFCRNPGADTMLTKDDVDISLIEASKIFHVGSLSLTNEPCRSAELFAIKEAKMAGCLISYDPNYREKLWGRREDAIPEMKSIFKFADIVKVSDEELSLLYGPEVSCEEGAKKIMTEGVSLVLITLGGDGVFYSANTGDASEGVIFGKVGTAPVEVVDTTGAGDSFTGGLLYRLTRRENPMSFDKADLEDDLRFANAVASLCVTKRGAIPALPTLEEVEKFLQK